MSSKKIILLSALILITVGGVAYYQIFVVDTSLDVKEASYTTTTNENASVVESENTSDASVGAETIPSGVVGVSDHTTFPKQQLSTQSIVGGLDAPRGFAFLPDGDVLITERFGSMKRVSPEGNITLIAGLPEVFASGQGGLLDVTIHPQFDTDNQIYLSYAHGTQEANRLRIARAVLADDMLTDLEVIFEVAQTKNGSQHFGSRFARLPDETLTFSVGDGGNPPLSYQGEPIREQAQYLSSHLGKIIRIHDDGSIPDDNPYVGRPDVSQEIYSYGHRNIQGVTYDTISDRLIASEHGSKGGDELNQIIAGKNYGRPAVTYATEYDLTGTPIAPDQSLPQYVDPLAVRTPTIAPSSVLRYDGDLYNDWQGDIFVAGMLLRADNTIGAYASRPAGAIMRISVDESGLPASQDKLLVGERRVRALQQGPDGYLYVLTDDTSQVRKGDNAGALIRILPYQVSLNNE